MDGFEYRDGRLCAEGVSLGAVAEAYGTPCYVYSRALLERNWAAFSEPLAGHPHLICYSVKANSNLAVLDVLARLGSGFDIVSVGELERVLAAGGDPARVVFSGVGKATSEIRRALQVGIGGFNVESVAELERVNRVAGELGSSAAISVRVNPDVDAQTHPYIATGLHEHKFGIPIADARLVYERALTFPHVRVRGIDCHIGSQLTSLAPFVEAFERILALVDALEGHGVRLQSINVGGGLGIRYRDEMPPDPSALVTALLGALEGRSIELDLEPGRAIAGNAGVLLTRVEYLKANVVKHFAVVDCAMNDLLRPALYGGWHDIVPVDERNAEMAEERVYDVVGPVCESGDFLGKDRALRVNEGALLAIRSAGAYAFCMSSNYNSRPRPCEVMVDGDRHHLVRERETVRGLFAGEHLLCLDS